MFFLFHVKKPHDKQQSWKNIQANNKANNDFAVLLRLKMLLALNLHNSTKNIL